MFTKISKLTQEQIEALIKIKDSVQFYNTDIRPGKNAPEIMSRYLESKWYSWSRKQKKLFQDVFESYMQSTVMGWFLHFPVNGFLDEMNYWENTVSCGSVVCFSLSDNNKIVIDGKETILHTGEGLSFNLKYVHSASKTDTAKDWVCLMQLV